jgi:hypothetical protein
MIQDLTNINDIIKNEGLEICVISYGGSGTNELIDILEMNGYKCKTPTYSKILCHCPVPIKIDIPIIYIYRNIIDAFFSQKRRGRDLWAANQQKLSNNLNTKLTDRNFLNLMANQFTSWKNSNLQNILFINYNECFDDNFKIKLEIFLKNPNLCGLPFTYKEPKTKYNINEIDPRLKKLFLEYQNVIDQTKK